MISTILIEDDVNIRNGMVVLLQQLAPDFQIVDQVGSVREGLASIEKHHPQVLFLDIQLSDGSSFDILKQLMVKQERISAKIVFVTAYEEYALKAFKFSALDYLLKPIDPEELQQVVGRIREEHQIQVENSQISLLFEFFKNQKQVGKLTLSTSDGIHIVSLQNIIRCESQDNYTKFFLKDDDPILISKTLKEYEYLLKDLGFERIHQSHLINLSYLKSYIRKDGGYAVMTDGTQLPVSLRKKDRFQKIISQL